MDAKSGKVLGRVKVGAVPRGIALSPAPGGKPKRAWVLNAVENSLSVLGVSNPKSLRLVRTIPLQDPTHPDFKAGRIAFNNADFSSTKSFSCASCHPDGHTDQLLWVLKTPIVTGGNQIMPRSTMPVRGLAIRRPSTGTEFRVIRMEVSTAPVYASRWSQTPIRTTRSAPFVTWSTAAWLRP